MAAATCLSLLAAASEDAIVQPILTYVEANIQSPDWHLREASVMAFGSILEGPTPAILGPLVKSAFPMLLGMMSDPVVGVKDTCAWTLGRVCELLMEQAQPFLPQLVQVCLLILTRQGSACWLERQPTSCQ
jgi:importin subunit beta-1